MVFNIKGNDYRLVVAVAYRLGAACVEFLFHFYIIREREGEEGDSTNVRLAKPTNFTDDLEMELGSRKQYDAVDAATVESSS